MPRSRDVLYVKTKLLVDYSMRIDCFFDFFYIIFHESAILVS